VEKHASVIVILLLLGCLPAAADPVCDSSFFDRARLEALIKTQKVTSIAQILKDAPDCIKNNQAAVYTSSSLQCATPKAPRMIIYVNDDKAKGNSLCSFNSGNREDYAEFYKKDPTINCHENSMECQSVDARGHFQYYEVTVPKNDQGKYFTSVTRASPKNTQISKINPPQCMTSCHRGDNKTGPLNPRPIIENYPAWPGFYGSFHDHLEKVPQEADDYQNKFLVYKKQNARYQELPDAYDDQLDTKNTNSKPVVNLQNLLEHQNYRRIASEFTDPKTLKKIWPFRYAILGSILCDDDIPQEGKANRNFGIETFLPEAVRNSFALSYAQTASLALTEHQQNIQSILLLQKKESTAANLDQFSDQFKNDMQNDPRDSYTHYQLAANSEFYNISRLAYLGLNLGIPAQDWSMTFKKTFDFEAGRHNPRELLPDLTAALLDPIQDKDLNFSTAAGYDIAVDEKQCTLLRNKSLAALNAAIANHQVVCNSNEHSALLADTTQNFKNIIRAVPVAVAAPANFSLCTGCHVNGPAKPIPFDDPVKLKNYLVEHQLTPQDINDRIESGNMPKNTILLKNEKTALEAYFTSILQ
jgi:hypothetical protein